MLKQIVAVKARVQEELGSSPETLTTRLRWVRHATRSIFTKEFKAPLEKLLKKDIHELRPEEVEWMRELALHMKDNEVLRDHPLLARLELKTRERQNYEALEANPWAVIEGDPRAIKNWEKLSSTAKVKLAAQMERLRRDPQIGVSKAFFPADLRFTKFVDRGTTYIIAYFLVKTEGKISFKVLDVGKHEGFYDPLRRLFGVR